jgi:protein-disulfide isomerase
MKRFVKTVLTGALASCLGFTAQAYAQNPATNGPAATPSVNVSPAERAKIQSVVHDYLLQNPQVIVEVLQVLQRKQFEQAEQTVKKTQQTAGQFATPLFHQANDPIAGNVQGKVSIVEFFDYQCPHCVDMAPVMTAIIKANPDVRIVYKEFPIRGPISEFASRAALAANMQGKYVQFSHALLTATPPLTQDGIMSLAKSAGLDVDKLKTDMNSDTVTKQLQANTKLAQDLKLFGTPAFFIGKTDGSTNISYVPGQMDQKQLQAAIDAASK